VGFAHRHHNAVVFSIAECECSFVPNNVDAVSCDCGFDVKIQTISESSRAVAGHSLKNSPLTLLQMTQGFSAL
jgi:hypothetical protein